MRSWLVWDTFLHWLSESERTVGSTDKIGTRHISKPTVELQYIRYTNQLGDICSCLSNNKSVFFVSGDDIYVICETSVLDSRVIHTYNLFLSSSGTYLMWSRWSSTLLIAKFAIRHDALLIRFYLQCTLEGATSCRARRLRVLRCYFL
jgi:hypothetical protein